MTVPLTNRPLCRHQTVISLLDGKLRNKQESATCLLQPLASFDQLNIVTGVAKTQQHLRSSQTKQMRDCSMIPKRRKDCNQSDETRAVTKQNIKQRNSTCGRQYLTCSRRLSNRSRYRRTYKQTNKQAMIRTIQTNDSTTTKEHIKTKRQRACWYSRA